MDFILFLQAALLGVVEGLTEYLPVSSTGHLVIVSSLLGFESVPGGVFEIVIQLGAILAVCVVYRQKLWNVAVQLPRQRTAQRFAGNIALAFLPAAIIGALAHGYIKEHLFNPLTVAVMLILGGIAILLIERRTHTPRYHHVDDFPPRLALLIGFIQCLAIIPGVSRSGATILGALLAGADRKAAAEFSFFLAIPTLAGATAYDLYKNWHTLSFGNLELIAIGFLAAFVSGLFVIRWMIAFVSRHGFSPFAWYRIALGGLILLFF